MTVEYKVGDYFVYRDQQFYIGKYTAGNIYQVKKIGSDGEPYMLDDDRDLDGWPADIFHTYFKRIIISGEEAVIAICLGKLVQ